MRRSIGPDNGENIPAWGEKGGSQRILLLVLLLVVVLFGYVYFFTGMITPREEEAKPKVAETQVVKKPIPSRTEKAPASKETAVAQQKGKEAASPKPVKAPEAAKPEPPNTAVSQVPKKEAAKQTPTAAPKQAQVPTPAAPAVLAKTAQQDKRPAQKAATPAEKAKAAPAPKSAAGAYTLLIGDFVLDRDLKATEKKLKKTGIPTFAIRNERKTEPMHRLHVADFSNRKDAEVELKKLLKLSPSSFILPVNGKHSLYAGSYFQETQAVKEKDRLSQKGGKDLKVTVQKVEVKVPVKRLTAGSFSTKEKALKEAGRVTKAGIPATVTARHK